MAELIALPRIQTEFQTGETSATYHGACRVAGSDVELDRHRLGHRRSLAHVGLARIAIVGRPTLSDLSS